MAKRINHHIGQMPMFQPQSAWRPPPLSSLPSWAEAKRVGIDLETCDPDLKTLGIGVRRNGRVVGVSFAIEDGPAHYLPFGHSDDNLGEAQVWAYLKDQAKIFEGILVGANLQYDLDYLAFNGVWFAKVKWLRDVQIAEPLIDELQNSYSLDNIAKKYDMPGKDETMLRDAASAWGVDPKKGMWQLPARFVGEYAIWDAVLPLQLLRRQERIIEEQNLWQIYDLESKVLPALLKMRMRGVAVNFKRLEQVEKWATGESLEALKVVKHVTGITIRWQDVWKASVLAPALESIGVTLSKTKTGQPSIDKDLLDRIDHPVAKALKLARARNKVVTTFAKSIREHAIKGRIHCTFNQLRMTKDEESGTEQGARYGRLSSTDPNMQQQPSMERWRSIYVPDDGKLWAASDYAQQEPRWLIHYAELCKFPKAHEAAEAYRTNPKTDNHQMMADMCGIKRKPAKGIFLGKCYGMGGAKMCHKLELPTKFIHSQRLGRLLEVAGPEGQALIDRFDMELPFVKMMANLAEKRAKIDGYITTVLGRRCRFPEQEGDNKKKKFDWCHKALNRLIQGSSADQTKAAMVQLDAEGYEPQLQVHDEIDGSVKNEKEAIEIGEIMKNCVPGNVPFDVDVEIGPSWGEAK